MDKIRIVDLVLGKEELDNITEAVKSGWISSKGKYIDIFEKSFASFIGTKYATTTSNGTTALHLAFAALGIKSGDEVIVPTLTIIANANTVTYTGAKPVFADSNPDYWCIDPESIEKSITKKTKAIVVVDLYGHPCDMDPIVKIAKDHGLYLIEDCAQAHGAEYKGKIVGSFGDISCFSFYGNKIVTTGEGGMCLTNNTELYEKMKSLKDQGNKPNVPIKDKYWTDVIGFNYRMTNLQAAIGAAQINKVKDLIKRRDEIGSYYNEALSKIKGVTIQPQMKWARSVYWYYSILVEKGLRDKVIEYLEKEGVETRPFFNSIHTLPMYKTAYQLPVAEDLSARGINLPTSPNLTEEKLQYITDKIKEFMQSNGPGEI